MRLLFIFLFCFAAALSGQAQERVRNVRIRVVDSAQLEIRYDLMNARPGDSVYVEVRSRLQGTLRISPEFVRGDVGIRISVGSDRRIIWNAVANGYVLNEEIQARVFVKAMVPVSTDQSSQTAFVSSPPVVAKTPETVVAKPAPSKVKPVAEPKPVVPAPAPAASVKKTNSKKPSIFSTDSIPAQPAPTVVSTPAPQPTAPPATTVAQPTPDRATAQVPVETAQAPVDSLRPRRSRYAGPAWALLSAVAPGIGNIFVQTPKPKIGLRPLLTVGCYGLLIYGFMERQKSQDAYSIYEQQKNMAAGASYYKTANDHHHTYFMATRGALVVAAADVVLTFIKGLRNSQIQKEARRYQAISLSPSLQAGHPTAMVRYSF